MSELYQQLNDLVYNVQLVPMVGIEGTLIINMVEHLMNKNNTKIIVISLKTLCELLNCHHSKIYSILNSVIQSYPPLKIQKYRDENNGFINIMFQKVL